MNHPKIIAVDFDGCLVTNCFPEIGEPIPETIAALKREQENGAKVILWTCRRDEQLTAAVDWCAQQNIHLDAYEDTGMEPEEVAEIARAKKDGRLALFPENTSITIPDVITSLGAVAFTCAATIPSITIPEGLERIGAGVFDDCLTLQEGAPK